MDRLDPMGTNRSVQTPDPTVDGTPVPAGGSIGGAFDAWRYREDVGVTGADLVGYKVEATDGGIGKVDSASYDVNASFVVVDTGPWIFGRKVMIPAGVINHVDHEDRKVYVDRAKDQIKAAPEFDPEQYVNPEYRDKIGGYYGDTYGTGSFGTPGTVLGAPGTGPPPTNGPLS